jgi:3-oxoacyl-[acyl-carrier-protein] synthase III
MRDGDPSFLQAQHMASFAAITGWGMALPDLERLVETTDDWIVSRTGIRERRIVGPDEYTSTLATAAGRRAMAIAGIGADAIDLVVLATCTPDRPFPATACTVQANLGISHAGAFDLAAACSGFVYGLSVATSMIQSGMARSVLFLAADVFSRSFINWQDRNTCVLFGDGAGALVLQASSTPSGMLACDLGASGADEDLMVVEGGGTRLPLTPEVLEQGKQHFVMQGREVFKLAVRGMADSSLRALTLAGLTLDQIALVVPHQANLRIIDAAAKRLNLPLDRFLVNLDRYGNTSAATIPIGLVEAAEQGRLKSGDNVLVTAFGGGLTWGSAVIRWGVGT